MYLENFIVVIPDGLINSKKGKQFLSNTYRAAILLAKKIAETKDDFILLLPANSFGGKLKEQEVASNFLIKNGFAKDKILIGISSKKGYLDTCDNFEEVVKNECKDIYGNKFYVSDALKNGKYILVSDYLHINRCLIIIKMINFMRPKNIYCSYAFEKINLPKRLFYYRWPYLRQIYELLATLYFILIKRLIRVFEK